MVLLAASLAPATTLTTTAETLAANIPPTQFTPPPNGTAVIIRGRVNVFTGTAITGVIVNLRGGQNNVSTNQVDTSAFTHINSAAVTRSAPFTFIDTNLANLTIAGYSITVTQISASGNGTISSLDYEVDYVVP